MKLKTKKFYKFLPKRLQTRRMAYIGVALVMLFSTLSYSLFFKKAPGVKAATIGTSSSNTATSIFTSQRRIVVSTNGTILAFINNGTESPTGIAYSKSTDNGASWSALTQVDTVQHSDFSVTIDGSDNIYLASRDSSAVDAQVRKLTYSGGTSWSIGSANSITGSGIDGITIAVTSDGKVWVNTNDGSFLETYYSSNLTSWTALTSFNMGSSSYSPPIVSSGNSVWTIDYTGNLYSGSSSQTAWQQASNFNTGASAPSLSYGLDKLHIFYKNGTSLYYESYDIPSATATGATTISSDGNDVLGTISTDSQNLWVFYQDYVASNSYNVVYKRFNGTSWDSSATGVTTDNLNNTSINSPERVNNTANLTSIWTTGTTSPYTSKSGTISTIGTVTDSGNQTGTYTGTLTGSSGDTVVKCGTWYYNTVNIVAGMTVKVCSSNGQTGGSLTIYADTVTIAGTLDGAGRGLPGGLNIYGNGGQGGTGGPGPSQSGSAGVAGTSTPGTSGVGSFGASGGTAGTSSAGGAVGGSGGANNGGGGGGGAGSTTTAGSNATVIGGYLGAATNGDTSTDESVTFGSGGGAGGSGGSGAGGGGGGGGSTTGWPAPGGAGGSGGRGGYGGKGGNGGAIIKIYSRGNLTVSGSIVATGQNGTTGSAGEAGQIGGGGAVGCDPGIC